MGDEKNIDTQKFRWSVWNYVMRVKGIVNDEFLYSDVNTFVLREVKKYLKTVTSFPHLCTQALYNQCMGPTVLKHSEKIHINLLATEARKQAELNFALQAVMEYAAGSSE
eukprot:m.186953 g.186953  ORF g.186953 m.186953 type:complete len:110 (+) comp21613_c1_seq1:629-958(+)